jgi:hypothetical protein
MQITVFFEIFSLTIPIILFLKFYKSKKNEMIFLIFIVGLFFGLIWEFFGTDFVWQYIGFYFIYYLNESCYASIFNLRCYGIPLAIPVFWGWMMVLIYLFSEKLVKFTKNIFRNRLIIFFILGLMTGGIFEIIAVSIGWWTYVFRSMPIIYSQESIYVVAGTVIIGWGIISLLNLSISTILYPKLKKRYNHVLVLLCILLLSLLNGFIVWHFIRYGVFPLLVYTV